MSWMITDFSTTVVNLCCESIGVGYMPHTWHFLYNLTRKNLRARHFLISRGHLNASELCLHPVPRKLAIEFIKNSFAVVKELVLHLAENFLLFSSTQERQSCPECQNWWEVRPSHFTWDLTCHNIFLWGYVMGSFMGQIVNLFESKQWIIATVGTLTWDMLRQAWIEVSQWVDTDHPLKGAHVEKLLMDILR
jgi:hypothetical protein